MDLDIRSGEFLTLLGPSGSGKTTLLMVLAGFTRPDRGSLKFGDREVIRTPPHLRDVGMVFQNYALFPHMTVAGNVGYPLQAAQGGQDRDRPHGSSGRSRPCSSAAMAAGGSTSSPAARSSAWRWPAPSCSSRASC